MLTIPTSETGRPNAGDAIKDRTDLDAQYRAIGILAVAAVLPYFCDSKNTANGGRSDKQSILAV
jgi:hypothetical protein